MYYLLALLLCAPSFAENLVYKIENKTALITDDTIPNINVKPTNNLRRRPGSSFFAKGMPLVIEGHVYDLNGIPVDNAKVIIVQTNHFGMYNENLDADSVLHDKHFISSGKSITNNNGEFQFFTVYPGKYEDRASHVHIIVSHAKIQNFETDMFFKNNLDNKRDHIFKKLKESEQNTVMAETYYLYGDGNAEGMRAKFDITLDIIQPLKKI